MAGASPIPFYVTYEVLTGTGTRFAATAAEAIVIYNLLKEAGMGGLAIRDETGTVHSIEQLTLMGAPLKIKHERDSGPSA